MHKGEDWKGLEEERIILENSMLVDYEYEPSERKIKYDFDELQGIIWGCSVKNAQKEEIRSIINKLCTITGRTDFEFYQAVKDPSSHEIWIDKEQNTLVRTVDEILLTFHNLMNTEKTTEEK